MEGGLLGGIDRHGDGGARAFAAAPPVGEFHDDAALLKDCGLTQNAKGLLRRHGHGLKEALCLQPVAQEFGFFRSGAHGGQKGVQCGLIFLAGVKLQGTGQRQVLGLAGGAEFFGEGGQEGEGTLGVGLVFGEVEGHAPDHMPGGALLAQPGLHALSGKLGDVLGQIQPPAFEDLGGEVFGPSEGGGGGDEGFSVSKY